MPTDTIIAGGDTLLVFNGDSVRCATPDGGVKTVFTSRLTGGDVHYRITGPGGGLQQIAFVRKDLPLAFDSLAYGGVGMHPHPDSVVVYNKKGGVSQTGYVEYPAGEDYRHAANGMWATYWQYDTQGAITHKFMPAVPGGSDMCCRAESYYLGGELRERWEQGIVHAGSFTLWSEQWDSLGNRLQEVRYEHLMPPGGQSYNDVFIVITTRDYYPSGAIRQVSFEKCFTESEQCPCGRWEYYDPHGKLLRTERHARCHNFKLESYR